MTLLGLVELSHTPKRAVRGSVLSTGLAAAPAPAPPRPWATLGLAVTSAAVKTAVRTIRFRIRIGFNPLENLVLGKTKVSILLLPLRDNHLRFRAFQNR